MTFVRRWGFLLFLFALLVFTTSSRPYKNGPPIRSDGVGYHLWTRALLERDLSFRKYSSAHGVSLRDPSRQIYQNKYPPGVALLRLPVMAFLVKQGEGRRRLISNSEHQANLILSALALLGTCFLCMRTCEMLSLGLSSTHIGLICFIFGTGLFHYATYDACFSHIYSALGVAVLLWLGARAIRFDQGRLPLIATAATAFFLVAIRNTNLILLFFLAAAYVLALRNDGNQRIANASRNVLPVLIGIIAATVLQLSYNSYANGKLTFSSYGNEWFTWERHMQGAVLFSYERGLFSYYPVVGLGLGAAFLVQRTRLAALGFTLLLLAYAGLYGCWPSWMLGGGFGHRGFVELMPLAIVLFAAALAHMKPGYRVGVSVCALACTFVTLEFMVGYWQSTVPFGGTTGPLYWSHVWGPHSLFAQALRHLPF